MEDLKKQMALKVEEYPAELPAYPSKEEVAAQAPGSNWRFHAAFGCLCVVNLVCAIDATSLAVALPIVADKLHGSGVEAFWAGTSFLLTATVFQPTFASLSHVFGRKPLLLIALTFFTIGGILCAIANDFTIMLLGRSIQGVGGGGISAMTYVIVTDMVSLKDRGKWFGLISMMWAFGSVMGPIIGGAFAEKVSWRWIFWFNIPFCAIAFITIPIFLKMQGVPGKMSDKLRRVDWLGSIIFIGSMTSFLIPITWGGVMYPWTHWRTLTPLIVGLCGLVFFVFWSATVPVEPILRGSMFKAPTALASYFGTVIHGMFLWSALYYMPLYFEAAKAFSPIMSGVALFPWTFTTGPAAVVVGLVVAKTGAYRWAIWSGWAITVVGVGLLELFEKDTKTVEWVCLSLVSGLGLGILYPAMSFAIQASASNKDLPFAAALYSFFRNFGQMLGVAVGGAIFQNAVKKNMETYPELLPHAAEFSKDASALVEIIKRMPTSPEGYVIAKRDLISSYVDALRTVWIIMCIMAGVAFMLSIAFTAHYSLDRELETEQGFVGTGGPVQQRKAARESVYEMGARQSRRFSQYVASNRYSSRQPGSDMENYPGGMHGKI